MLAPGGDTDAAPDVVNNSWSGGSVTDDWYMDAVANYVNAEILPVFSAGNQRQGEPTTMARFNGKSSKLSRCLCSRSNRQK